LIPKKGDISKLKNWRPISLLNVLYKIGAKALNNRLKRAAPYIISRSQKGFVDKKFIQECLINIAETVQFAEKNRIKSFCLALDQAKAFDSLNHAFMTDVYKFFGFGDQFIKMLNTLTTGRTANILFDDGSKGSDFPLECGNAQGNSPSPLQFNFGEQILLFKLEFLPLINSILPLRIGPRMDGDRAPLDGRQQEGQEGGGQDQRQEGNILGVHDKVEAFADDGTVLARAEEAALTEIKLILENFAIISGLRCNMDKSTIMLMGFAPNEAIPDWITNSGFKTVNETHALGCVISTNSSDFSSNFNKVEEKIAKTKRFWERFNVSLPGRIAIAKSLMLAQVSYVGCFCDPDPDVLKRIKILIEEFIKGRLGLAKDKMYISPKYGGIGMIDLDDFLVSIKCGWLKRIHNGVNDTYKEIFRSLGCFNLSYFNINAVDKNTWPILSQIWGSVCKFVKAFVSSNNNWKAAPVLYHPLLVTGRGGAVYRGLLLA
jgi:hypothetical protein